MGQKTDLSDADGPAPQRSSWSPLPSFPLGHGSPSVDSSSVVTVPKPSTPSRISFFMRQSSFSAETSSPSPRSPGTPTGSPCHNPVRGEERSELDGNYLTYLRDARMNIDRCVWACRMWSAPYDGEEPSSSNVVPALDNSLPINHDYFGYTSFHTGGHLGHVPTSPRTKKRGLPEEAASPAAVLAVTEPGAPASPGPEDLGILHNGAHTDTGIKKVRWYPQGSVVENGSASIPSPAWEESSHPDSLLDELLNQAPTENGAALAIETFTEELSRIENEMENGGREEELGPAPLPSPDPDPLSHEEEEAYQSFNPDSTGQSRPTDPLAQIITSPPRNPGQPPSQPFTGESSLGTPEGLPRPFFPAKAFLGSCCFAPHSSFFHSLWYVTSSVVSPAQSGHSPKC